MMRDLARHSWAATWGVRLDKKKSVLRDGAQTYAIDKHPTCTGCRCNGTYDNHSIEQFEKITCIRPLPNVLNPQEAEHVVHHV